MKIINRLYFKVILIAVILTTSIVVIYYTDNYYEKKSKQQLKNLELINKNDKTKIDNLELINKNFEIKMKHIEKKIINYENTVNNLKKSDNRTIIYKEKILPIKKNKNSLEVQKYKKIIMYNIHHQILQELKYAPYLPVSQLQEMMEKRFVLGEMTFYILIKKNFMKSFNGIKINKNTTYSIIRDGELLEVKFDTK